MKLVADMAVPVQYDTAGQSLAARAEQSKAKQRSASPAHSLVQAGFPLGASPFVFGSTSCIALEGERPGIVRYPVWDAFLITVPSFSPSCQHSSLFFSQDVRTRCSVFSASR